MYEITYDNDDVLDQYKAHRTVYAPAKYAFTFENRFIVYYYFHSDVYEYVAFDTESEKGSTIVQVHEPIPEDEFKTLIPKILLSIKYTGDTRRVSK